MVRNLTNAIDDAQADIPGDVQPVSERDLNNGKRLDSNRYVPIGQFEATKSGFEFWGFGSSARDGNTGFLYADLKGSQDINNDGTDETVDLDGRLRLEVYEDQQAEQPKAFSGGYSLSALREAANESRTDRPMLPLQNPGAKDDQVIVVSLKVAEKNDGATLDAFASDANIPRTVVYP